MANTQHEFDLKLMELQANFMSSMTDYAETFTKYQSIFSQLSIDPSSISILRKYHSGLESLTRASQNLSDAFKAMCAAYDVDITEL